MTGRGSTPDDEPTADGDRPTIDAVAASERAPDSGKAPGPLKQFWWDLLPKKSPDCLVPRQSGLRAPDVNLDWLTREIAEKPDALEQTRRAHDLERERAASLESKAGSMVTLCLTLLATALAIAGYQIGFLRREHEPTWWLLIPAVLSVGFLALAAISSLEVQRVGIYQWEGAEPLGREPGGRLGLVRSEETGRRLAGWSAGLKANGLLQARAWLSRALVALIVSAIVAIGMATRPVSNTTKPRTVNTSTSTSTTPTTSISTTTR